MKTFLLLMLLVPLGLIAKPYERLYNPRTIETVQGEVTSVGKFTSANGRWSGVHLTIEDDTGEVDVHLGPRWYLKEKGMTIAVGDQVTVVGSRASFKEKDALIASTVSKDGKSVTLRHQDGKPLWRGRGWHRTTGK